MPIFLSLLCKMYNLIIASPIGDKSRAKKEQQWGVDERNERENKKLKIVERAHTSNGALASDIYSHSGALGIALITDLISIERSQQCMIIGEFVKEFQSFSLLPHFAV